MPALIPASIRSKVKKITSDPPEKEIEKLFVKLAEKKGFQTFKFISSVDGVTDRLFLPGNGITAYIELKRETGSKQKNQKLFKKKMKKAGYLYFCLNSKKKVINFFKGEKWNISSLQAGKE